MKLELGAVLQENNRNWLNEAGLGYQKETSVLMESWVRVLRKHLSLPLFVF